MMNFSPKLTHFGLLLAVTGGLALAPSARAQSFTFAFTPPTETVMAGSSVDYTGVFTNNTGSDYYITGGAYNGNFLISGFFNGDPTNGDPNTGAFEVLNGQRDTVSGVFTLAADSSTPPGAYLGTVDFSGETAADYAAFQSGGPDNSAVLGSAPLSLTVQPGTAPVPEASSVISLGLLLTLGLGGMVLVRRKHHAESQA